MGVVAVVGNVEVPLETFQVHLEAVTGLQWEGVDSRACSRLLDRYLEQEGVLVASGDQPGDAPFSRTDRLEMIKRCTIELCGPVPDVPPSSIEAAINARVAEGEPQEIHLRQLLVDSLEVATEVRRRLSEGESFDDLSIQVSRAPNADRGGELGWFSRGVLPENVEEAVFHLAAGEVSEPVGGLGGYHLFQVIEIKEAGLPSPERVRETARLDLQAQLGREHLEDCFDRTAREVGIEVIRDNLWFEYDGKYSEENDD